jgi:alpha-mannosidase
MRRSALLPVVLLIAVGIPATAWAEDAKPTSGAKPASSAKPASGAKLDQVVVVFKTHFDIGYTDLARNVVDRYRTSMIDKALDVCDSTQKLPPENRFVWTVPGWPMAQILWDGQTPERRARIEKAIRDGRLVWHALPVTTHTESLEPEDLVRGLRFSSELSRRFGQPLARDAKMTDVPSHSWIMPTLLKHAGVEFLHIGCNSASASPDVPRLFWWEGPDGSRVLTFYEASGYGSGLKPPADWPHRTWLALIHTGDNAGPPSPGDVQKLLDQAKRELPGVKLRMGRLSDFSDAILAEKPDLPVVRKDMPDTWIHGIMSMPRETAIARTARPRVAALESLNTLLRVWRVEAPPADPTLKTAYEQSLMYGEHTWGASMPLDRRLYGDPWRNELAAGRYKHLEESWREKGGRARLVGGAILPFPGGLGENVKALAGSVNVNGLRLVVFNPMPWTRDGVIRLSPGKNPADLKDVATGAILPVEKGESGMQFVARDLPPLGYRTYVAMEGNRKRPEGSRPDGPADIEGRFFRVRVDPARGVVTSILDKRSGRELVDAKSKHGLGQYLYERFDAGDNDAYLKAYCKYIPSWYGHFARFQMPPAKEVPYQAASPKEFQSRLYRDSLSQWAEMESVPTPGVPHRVKLKVVVYRDLPYLDVEWEIRSKPPETWPEAGWLCLPLNIEKPQYRLGRPGGVVDPATECAKGSNFDVFCLNSGMTVTGPDGRGVGLCPLDSPLVSLGRPGVYRYTREWTPREPVVFVNLFNNVWGTNFQQWIGGSWTSGVRIWAVEGKGIEADLVTPSWEARVPCLAAWSDGPPGKWPPTLPPTRSGIELSRRGVLVTAFGANPDGDGTILRLWEQAGQDGPLTVRLPDGLRPKQVRPCDLRGRPQGAPIPVADGRFTLLLGRYAPASVLIP